MDTRDQGAIPDIPLEESLGLRAGTGMTTRALPARSVPALSMADGPIGLRDAKHAATAFPAPIALASSWDPELVAEIAGAIAEEFAAMSKQVILGPTLDLLRHPRYGRAFETMGEDPHLTAVLGVAYIEAVQARGLLAVAKHFVANNQETGKHEFDQHIDARTLHELYLAPFRAAVGEARVGAIMGAYNKVNGAFCCQHAGLLRDILREQWGFEGLVISDWGAVYEGEPAFFAGCDLEMPGGDEFTPARLKTWIARDPAARALQDASIRRIVTVAQNFGSLPAPAPAPDRLRTPTAQALARRAAATGMVLLRNESSILPLDPASLRHLAVIGPGASRARIGGGGSSQVKTATARSPAEALSAAVGAACQVSVAEGAFLDTDAAPVPENWIRSAPDPAAPCGWTGRYRKTDFAEATEGFSRIDPTIAFNWHTDGPDPAIGGGYDVRWQGWLTPPATGEYEFGLITGAQKRCHARVRLDEEWLFDRARSNDESAALPSNRRHLEAGRSYPIEVHFTNELGFSRIHLTLRYRPPGLREEAVEIARAADAAVVFAGYSGDHESEGRDRPSLELPEEEVELIESVLAVNPRTVVVLNTGGPILPGDWMERVPALLMAWFPGEFGAEATAGVLTGSTEPEGRLPCTLPRRAEDCRALANFPTEADGVHYREGLHIGYRDYDAAGREVAFPFGFGLGYTTWALDSLRVEEDFSDDSTDIVLGVNVTNTGSRKGSTVIQVYAAPLDPSLPRPVRELKAFQRVSLEPGTKRRVRLKLPRKNLMLYDDAIGAWREDPGRYRLEVGFHSRELPLSLEVFISRPHP